MDTQSLRQDVTPLYTHLFMLVTLVWVSKDAQATPRRLRFNGSAPEVCCLRYAQSKRTRKQENLNPEYTNLVGVVGTKALRPNPRTG